MAFIPVSLSRQFVSASHECLIFTMFCCAVLNVECKVDDSWQFLKQAQNRKSQTKVHRKYVAAKTTGLIVKKSLAMELRFASMVSRPAVGCRVQDFNCCRLSQSSGTK